MSDLVFWLDKRLMDWMKEDILSGNWSTSYIQLEPMEGPIRAVGLYKFYR